MEPRCSCELELFFTPVFGSYIQMLNWKTLSEPEKAASAKTWFYISIGVLLAELVYSIFWEVESRITDLFLGFAALVYLIVWWISTGRWQGIYLREKFGAIYSRKPWGKPLLLVIGAYIIVFALIFVMGAVIGFISDELITSTSTVTTPATAPIPTPITNSQTSSGKSRDCDVCPAMVPARYGNDKSSRGGQH